MSSPAQPKVLLRHSLYVWVLLAMVGILSMSFVVFRAISQKMQAERIDPVYDRFDELQLESARAILQRWGQEALAQYFTGSTDCSADRIICWMAMGRISFGVDRSEMLPKPPAVKSREAWHGHWEITHRSARWEVLVCGGRSGPAMEYLGVSAVLLPGSGRDRDTVLDCCSWGDFADSADREQHCAVRTGRSGRAGRDGSRR